MEGEDAYYLFLPSHADMNDVCLTSYASGFDVLSTGERIGKKDSLSAFSITLKDEVSLFGLGAGQKYALLSNASDPTLIRNDIARRLEAAVGAEHDNIGRFIDLYSNGEYLGNYYLCENIEIGDDRIAVTNLEEQMDL